MRPKPAVCADKILIKLLITPSSSSGVTTLLVSFKRVRVKPVPAEVDQEI